MTYQFQINRIHISCFAEAGLPEAWIDVEQVELDGTVSGRLNFSYREVMLISKALSDLAYKIKAGLPDHLKDSAGF